MKPKKDALTQVFGAQMTPKMAVTDANESAAVRRETENSIDKAGEYKMLSLEIPTAEYRRLKHLARRRHEKYGDIVTRELIAFADDFAGKSAAEAAAAIKELARYANDAGTRRTSLYVPAVLIDQLRWMHDEWLVSQKSIAAAAFILAGQKAKECDD